MTRRFRLGLFVCLAAAVGLHVRPCVLTLVRGGEAVGCGAPAALVSLPTAAARTIAPAVAPAVLASSAPVTARPALASMCDAPELVLLRTAEASGR